MTAEQRAACGAAARFEEAIAGTGVPRIDDHNAPGAVGVGALPVNCTGGRRISTAIAYLEPARHRANLTIMAGRPVRQIVTRAGRPTASCWQTPMTWWRRTRWRRTR